MSRVIRFDQFLPVERNKFLSALEAAQLPPGQFEVSKMEISPPLMEVTGLVTVKLAASALAYSYEDAPASSWVEAFIDDLRAGRFGGSGVTSDARQNTLMQLKDARP